MTRVTSCGGGEGAGRGARSYPRPPPAPATPDSSRVCGGADCGALGMGRGRPGGGDPARRGRSCGPRRRGPRAAGARAASAWPGGTREGAGKFAAARVGNPAQPFLVQVSGLAVREPAVRGQGQFPRGLLTSKLRLPFLFHSG